VGGCRSLGSNAISRKTRVADASLEREDASSIERS
jgi:hypothetical protein